MSQVRVNEIVDANGGSNVVLRGAAAPVGGMNFRNRIINGDMRIDQRNNGASVTITTGAGYIFPVDRFGNFNNSGVNYTAQRVADAPAGFTNSVRLTFASAISLTSQNEATFFQIIEGFNVADFGWGTANATAITVGLWVKASFTGVNSIGFCNHNGTRAYATTYTINAANTWEFKTFVIPGDTAGVWLTDNSAGLFVRFNIAAGSNFQVSSNNAWTTRSGAYNAADGAYGTKAIGTPSTVSAGATWQITGVQLEAGSVATPFERVPYGTQLALCQRYYQQLKATLAVASSTSGINANIQLLVQMRATPSLGKTAGNFAFGDMVSQGFTSSGTPVIDPNYLNQDQSVSAAMSGFTGLTQYRVYRQEPITANPALFAVSAEL